MKENGFTSTFAFPNRPELDIVLAETAKYGISLDNLHAPFDGINEIWAEGPDGDRMLDRLIRSVDVCADAEIPALVVHLSGGLHPPIVCETGHRRFARLMEHAEKKGVTVCYENQRMLSNLAYVFEQFPAARFCWDAGHEGCFTPGRRYMPLFGQYLGALHLHDNHGVFNQDEHLIPFDGTLDYGYIASEIAKSGYTGTVMLELIRANSPIYADLSPEDYYRRAGEAAKKLEAMIAAEDEKYDNG